MTLNSATLRIARAGIILVVLVFSFGVVLIVTRQSRPGIRLSEDPTTLTAAELAQELPPQLSAVRDELIELFVSEALGNTAYAPQLGDQLNQDQMELLQRESQMRDIDVAIIMVAESNCAVCANAIEYIGEHMSDVLDSVPLVVIERLPIGSAVGDWSIGRVVPEFTSGPASAGVFGTIPSIRIVVGSVVRFVAYGTLLATEKAMDVMNRLVRTESDVADRAFEAARARPLVLGYPPEMPLRVAQHGLAVDGVQEIPGLPAPELGVLIVHDQTCAVCRVFLEPALHDLRERVDKGLDLTVWVLLANNPESRSKATYIASRYPWAVVVSPVREPEALASPLAADWLRVLTPDVLVFRSGSFFAGFHPPVLRWGGMSSGEVDSRIGADVLSQLLKCAVGDQEGVGACGWGHIEVWTHRVQQRTRICL